MENETRGKRKKRKSLLQNARKYGKKGKFGRGSHLNEDIYQYFVRVLELLKTNNFETEEEKAIFINNVFDETINEEINYSCNQLASAALENLLPEASNAVIKRFIEAFGKDLRPICTNPYASHILERLLLIASERGMTKQKEGEEETTDFTKWVLKVSQFVLNNLEDFVWDTYANHIIRTIMECLGGISSGTAARSHKKQSFIQVKMKSTALPTKSRDVPSSYTKLLGEYVQRLCSWPQFQDLGYSNLTSGLLQALLFATKEADNKLNQKLISKILNECFSVKSKNEDKLKTSEDESCENKNILPLFEDAAAIHLLEAAIATASPKKWILLYESCFYEHLVLLSQSSLANFSVQKLIDCCTVKDKFEQIFNEMEEHIEDILSSRNFGVILSLAQACRRLAAKQGSFQQKLMNALHCIEPSERQSLLAPLTVNLVPYESYKDSSKFYVNLHGSLILQEMLNFHKPIKVVNSLLDMNANSIKTLFTDPKGCHVMDAFMISTFVGEKSRDRMVKKLKGMYVLLACSKHGSRSLDAIWEVSNLKQKLEIMDELSPKEPILNSDQYGSILASKYCVSLYKHRREEWKDMQGKENRKKKLFADIIGKVGKSR